MKYKVGDILITPDKPHFRIKILKHNGKEVTYEVISDDDKIIDWTGEIKTNSVSWLDSFDFDKKYLKKKQFEKEMAEIIAEGEK